jgi:hypothetical protein
MSRTLTVTIPEFWVSIRNYEGLAYYVVKPHGPVEWNMFGEDPMETTQVKFPAHVTITIIGGRNTKGWQIWDSDCAVHMTARALDPLKKIERIRFCASGMMLSPAINGYTHDRSWGTYIEDVQPMTDDVSFMAHKVNEAVTWVPVFLT